MAWYKNDANSDKVVLITGDKYLISSLSGSKDVININATADKSEVLLGDKNLTLTVDADKIISLLGSVGVSLEGAKRIATILGELSTTINLLGEAPYSYFKIRIDTTYITVDYTDVKVDRD